MTFQQASETILSKALSYTNGWVRVKSSFDEGARYAHDGIPGVYLRWLGEDAIHLIDSQTCTPFAESEELTRHSQLVFQTVREEEIRVRQNDLKNRIIAIAERL